jgi:hypothetical protein
MIFIKRRKNRQRSGVTVVSVQKDIEQLQSHDWSDPLLDEHFTTVVENLVHTTDPTRGCDEQEEDCPPFVAGHGADRP